MAAGSSHLAGESIDADAAADRRFVSAPLWELWKQIDRIEKGLPPGPSTARPGDPIPGWVPECYRSDQRSGWAPAYRSMTATSTAMNAASGSVPRAAVGAAAGSIGNLLNEASESSASGSADAAGEIPKLDADADTVSPSDRCSMGAAGSLRKLLNEGKGEGNWCYAIAMVSCHS